MIQLTHRIQTDTVGGPGALPCSEVWRGRRFDPCPGAVGHQRNLAAFRFHVGHHYRLLLRRPLPTTLNNDLAITPRTPSGQSRRTQLLSVRFPGRGPTGRFRPDPYELIRIEPRRSISPRTQIVRFREAGTIPIGGDPLVCDRHPGQDNVVTHGHIGRMYLVGIWRSGSIIQ